MSTQFVKNLSIKNIQYNQTVLIQPIQFSISIDFVYTELNVKNSFLSNSAQT